MSPSGGMVSLTGATMKDSKMPAFNTQTLKAMASTFPYKDKPGPLSLADYRTLAKAQRVEEFRRRTDFLTRLTAYKEKHDDSVRAFPTPDFFPEEPPVIGWIDDAPPCGLVLPFRSQQGADLDVHDELPPHDDRFHDDASPVGDYPFEVPPIDPSQYGSVEVDEAYDQTGPVAPQGSDAQPDIGDWSKATVGVVTTIGSFPYLYKKDANKVFMVRIGTKDHWGVDLKRLVREFNIKKGSKIALMCIGKQPVVVQEKVPQPDGSIKTVEKDALRNCWVAKFVS